MESIRLTWPIPDEAQPGSTIVPFTDWGTGAVDYTDPIGPPVYARAPHDNEEVWLDSAFLESPFLGDSGRAGFLEGLFLEHLFLDDEDTASILLAPMYGPGGGTLGNGSASGTFRFGAKLYDRDGRVSAAGPAAAEETEVVINTSPRGAQSLVAKTLVAGVMTCEFTPSVDLR